MANDLRSYNAGRQSFRVQPPPVRQVSGIGASSLRDTGSPFSPAASEMDGSGTYTPSGMSQASPTGGDQTDEEGISSEGTVPGICRTNNSNIEDSSISDSEISHWKPILDLEPENILKGILYSEILSRPKSMRRGRR